MDKREGGTEDIASRDEREVGGSGRINDISKGSTTGGPYRREKATRLSHSVYSFNTYSIASEAFFLNGDGDSSPP